MEYDYESASSLGDESIKMVDGVDWSSNMDDLTLSDPVWSPVPMVNADGWTVVLLLSLLLYGVPGPGKTINTMCWRLMPMMTGRTVGQKIVFKLQTEQLRKTSSKKMIKETPVLRHI
ncbi:hypothetical protein L1887_30660 [Cichorium endivia]|nr:hypothetical protein L1887_30660 [Cichorium endivia]